MKTAQFILLATSLVMVVPGYAQDADYVYWQSEGPTAWDIGTDVTTLYVDLQKAGLLRSRGVSNSEGRTVLQILLDEKLWFAGGYTWELDRLMCELNRHVCSEREDGTIEWTNGKEDIIQVPDLHFEIYSAISRYKKRKGGESLEDAVVKDRRGCVAFDSECRQAIENLNSRRGDVMSPEYEGDVIVPTMAVRTAFHRYAEPHEATQHQDTFDRRIGFEVPPTDYEAAVQNRPVDVETGALEKHYEQIKPSLNEIKQPSPEQVKQLQYEKVYDPFIRNTVPQVKAVTDSFNDVEDPAHAPPNCSIKAESVAKLFRMINHPDIDPGPYYVAVAVIDGWTDHQHCEFEGLSMDALNATFRDRFQRSDCGDCEIATFIKPNDHGTHVAAIISMIVRGPDKDLDGLVPRVFTLEVNEGNPNYARQVSDVVQATMHERIDVFNVSSSYEVESTFGGTDPVENTISQFRDNKLFVVAAGNEKKDLTAGCSVFPACFELPNIINVMALDEGPAGPRPLGEGEVGDGTNYGIKTHIGAPGKNVLSALHGNKYGLASGTSQATPIVAAAAALLLATDDHLRPRQVKERLIYTSDIHNSLRGKVLGGQLNLKRALDYKHDHIRFRDSGGQIQDGIGRVSYATLFFREFGSTSDKQISWNQILRLHQNQGATTHTVFIRDANGTPERLDHVRVRPTSNSPMTFVANGSGVPQDLQPGNVIDYVARIK